MEIFGEILLDLILEPILYFIFVWPGAAFRWLVSRLWNSPRSLRYFVKDEPWLSGTLGLTMIVLAGAYIFS